MPRRIKNHLPPLLLIAALLLGILHFSGCEQWKPDQLKKEKEKQDKLVVVEPVALRTMHDYVRISGIARARVERPLYFKQQGVIEKIFVEEGEEVSTGTLLAELDSEIIGERLEQSRLGLKISEAEYDSAKINYERSIKLHKEGAIIDRDLEDSLLRYRQAEGSKLNSEREIAISELELRQTSLFAPLQGIVAYRNIEEGDFFNGPAGQPPFVLIQPEMLDLEVFLPENLISAIRPGQVALIQYEDYSCTGTVIRINPAVDLNNRSVKTVIEIPNPRRKIKSGAFVEGRIETTIHPDAPVIPLKAMIVSGQKKIVYTWSEDNTVRRRELTTGIEDEKYIEILDPLFSVADRIVIQGQYNLDDGDVVRLQEKGPEAQATPESNPQPK